jgi:hypothetical protein
MRCEPVEHHSDRREREPKQELKQSLTDRVPPYVSCPTNTARIGCNFSSYNSTDRVDHPSCAKQRKEERQMTYLHA